MNADGIGSAQRDFLPPIPALGQAISFRLLGLNQFSVALAASIVSTGIVCLLFALARGLGLPRSTSLLASIGFAFVPQATAMAMRVRFDNWTVLFWAGALYLILIDRRNASIAAQWARGFAGGMLFALACFSYYAFGPTLLVLFAAILIARFAAGSGPILPTAFVGGSVSIAALFLLWVGSDYPLFISQNLAMLREYAWYQSCAKSLLQCAAVLNADRGWILGLIALMATIIALIVLTIKDIASKVQFTPERCLWVAIGCLSVACWTQCLITAARFSLFATTFSVLFIIYRLHLSPDSRISVLMGTGLLTVFALIGTGLTLAVDYRGLHTQRAARSYAPFGQAIRAAADTNGLVLTDLVGWLALRGVTKAGQLHLLLPVTGEPPELNRSLILFDPNAANRVTTVIVTPANLAAFRAQMPLVDAAIRRSDMRGPIEIGTSPGPYWVYLYRVAGNNHGPAEPRAEQ